MNKFNLKVIALTALLVLGASKGFAQEEEEEIVYEEDTTTAPMAVEGEEAPVPAEEDSYELSEEEY